MAADAMAIERLRQLINVGNFRDALTHLKDRVDEITRFEGEAHAGRADIEDVAALAEMRFYVGDNDGARTLLKPYIRRVSGRFPDGTSPRAQLQFAEYHYSLSTDASYSIAAAVARRVLNDATAANIHVGVGEAAYYLMRICRRLHQYADVAAEMHRAIDAFGEAKWQKQVSPAVRLWRVGCVHLVAGFNDWREGNLSSAVVHLETAQLLLKSKRDPLARANVMHTMGALRRSQGRLPQALALLGKAHELYSEAGHNINLARVLTDLGRTHLAAKDWRKADDCFERANTLAGTSARARAENDLWRGWLALWEKPGDPAGALGLARQAVEAAATSSYSIRVEGRIAEGYAAAALGDVATATEAFNGALDSADKHGKHRVNAILSLADLHAGLIGPPDFSKAASRLNEAYAEIARLSISSTFLTDKAEKIANRLRGAHDRLFVRTIEDIRRDKVPASVHAFRQWIHDVSRAEDLEALFGIKKESVWRREKRLKQPKDVKGVRRRRRRRAT